MSLNVFWFPTFLRACKHNLAFLVHRLIGALEFLCVAPCVELTVR